MANMHPFERSGLGTAPFKCVGVTKNLFTIPGVPEATKPGSSCDHCGTGITYEYWIVGATGSRFKVGCDCVMKTGGEDQVDGFRAERLKLARARRDDKKAGQRAQWAAQKKAREDARLAGLSDTIAAFKADHADFVARLERDQSSFAKDLWGKLHAWGSLTQPQMDAIKRGWAREDAKALERETSAHVGAVGKRHTVKLTIVTYTSRQAEFWPHPTSYWHLLKDDAGNVYTYRGSTWLGDRGATVKGTFSVKEHTVYQGTKQTVLARPKLEPAAQETTTHAA